MQGVILLCPQSAVENLISIYTDKRIVPKL